MTANLTAPDAMNRTTTASLITTNGLIKTDWENETLESFNVTSNRTSTVRTSSANSNRVTDNFQALPPLCLLVIVTVASNLALALVIAIEKRMHKLANAYIFAVACADMLNGCGPMVLMVAYTVYGTFRVDNTFHCYMSALLDQVIPMVDMSLIFLMAFDRYTAIMNPLEYSKPTRKITIAIQISLAYVIPFLLWTPPLFLYAKDNMKRGSCYIILPSPSSSYIQIAQYIGTYFVVFVATSYLYGRCVWALWLQFFKVQPRLLEGTGKKKDTHVAGNKVSVVNTNQSNNEKSVIGKEPITSVSFRVTLGSEISTEHSGQSTEKLTPVGSAVRPPVVHTDKSSKRRNDLVRSLRNVGIYAFVYSVLIMPYAAETLVNRCCRVIYNKNCIVFGIGMDNFMYWTPYLQSTVHPILYAVTQREFRSAALKLCKKLYRFLFCCRSPI